MHIMILNDGETFTGLAGCKLVQIDPTKDSVDDVEDAIREGDYTTLVQYGEDPHERPVETNDQMISGLMESVGILESLKANAIDAGLLDKAGQKALGDSLENLHRLVVALRNGAPKPVDGSPKP